jgi:hypothetical protein
MHKMEKVTKNTIISEVGFFPELNERYREYFPTGKIVLKKGEHRGPNKGFGIDHILAEHKSDLSQHNLAHSDEGVICYVQLILRSGAQIYSEFASLRGFHRPMVIKSSTGTVVLERKDINGETLYSVVTAFGGTVARGTQIGTFK